MSKTEPAGRLARWALKIQEYDIEIGYRPGKTHQNADTLSRTPVATVASVETRTKSEMKQEESEWVRLQHEDDYCKRIIENLMKIRSQNARNING
ncbi:reverse transcriptase/ribonuclease H [Daphnia sinensis]|uniref:Reverse transcriptase/ribonuclease H n=1 Tax=Daphnia sinensis TaxID=1820382 RepID=A0AAD5KU15_9CRUS|nr:reverse transcriptase/ribonuclease H [Daphnia sinensis]KAI9560562.1 reverse transcriptase/ribonuclease H [Daphnia sinensis]KAI9560563.1 reverse transcriptase/ribonuclease H [Daphnia sinensis]